MVGVTHVLEIEFSLSSCVCVWVEGCSYAIPQHTHVHLSYSGSGLASPDGWNGGWEPILNCKAAAGWAAMCRDAPDSTGTRIKYSSVHDRVVCRNPHAEIRGLPREVRPDYFDVCRPQRGLVCHSGLAEPLNVRPTT